MADYDVKVLEISKGGNTYTYDAGGTHYAVCDTAAGTQTKAVTISEIASLTTGLSVRIKFSNAQTYNGQPKLQINSLTATNIVRMGTTAAARYEWNAGEVLDFVYDGTNFIIQEGAVPTTTYYGGRIKLSSATNSTSEVLAATPKAVKAAYDLANGKASTSVASQSANGLMSSTDKTKLDGIATGATANVGTITGITMNGASKGTSGVVNLGTVLTSHQDISSKANRDEIGIVITGNTASQNVTSGQYVIVRNSTISGISDGLYTASANVSAGTVFTSANLTAVSNGGLNSLNEHFSMVDLGIVSDMAALVSAISTLESDLEKDSTRFVKFNTNTPTDYWHQWEWHTGIVQKDDTTNWTAVFVSYNGDTLDIGSSGNYYSSKEERNKFVIELKTGSMGNVPANTSGSFMASAIGVELPTKAGYTLQMITCMVTGGGIIAQYTADNKIAWTNTGEAVSATLIVRGLYIKN